jgi:alkylhydroperoxidase family enzyme
MSARSAVALQEGVNEPMLASVDQYEQSDLSSTQKAALRLADAYLMSPADMSDSVKGEVAAQLTPGQVVELTIKLMGFSNDKVMVALGLDMDEIQLFTL